MANKLTVFNNQIKAITGNWNTQDTMAKTCQPTMICLVIIPCKPTSKDNYESKLELQQIIS